MKFYDWLNENKNKIVVCYSGRFQPFHKGHYETYQNIMKKFGKKNIYITTSNKVDLPKSPFNFTEKQRIITKMFKIPINSVVQIKNPYAPTEVLSQYTDDHSYITIVGKKDADRLVNGKYFELYKDGMEMLGYKEKGYVWIAPENTTKFKGKTLSGTYVRELFKEGSEEDKKELFKALYPKFDQGIFELIVNKLGE